ncbi:SOUL family heme-binding protein [Sphingomonas mesophila]|uniref:SOUL family heme-binding protein n=1 Tax=Sphingomonas mesophila TaxID=2303576 RepID=UPI000E569092|nr:heme-binding protein [Sphingomonas mesophila]
MRKDVAAGAAVLGAALAGAAIYFVREKATPGPDYRVLVSDGDFEIRAYPPIIVAEAAVQGERKEALNRGFELLASYIFDKSAGEPIGMTVPVLQDSGNPMASDPPLFDDEVAGGWRVRFVMPEGRTLADLPEPPAGIELRELPARRVGAVRFSGLARDEALVAEEDRLRGWLARHGESCSTAEPEYAFYNSPMIPPPLKRNEVLLPLG